MVFDLDDTLYPERDYVLSGYQAVSAQLQLQLKTDRRFDHWLWQRFMAGKSAGAFDTLNAYFRLGMSKADIKGLVEVYRNHVPFIHPYDDVPATLERLHKRCKLGLLSDGLLPAQQLKLDVLGLARHFDAVVFTEELGRKAWKPSAAGFERASKLLDTPHESCAYVADNPCKDFVAPNKLGWLTVQFLRPDQVYSQNPAPSGGEPQVVVNSAAKLRTALG